MTDVNAIIAWAAVVAGVVTGAAAGLLFHRETWLGGYGSWPRRMIRLGHISFFGIAALNLGYSLTVHSLGWAGSGVASVSLAAANLLMPAVCYLSAWKKPLRHLFVVPVACVLVGAGALLCSRGHS